MGTMKKVLFIIAFSFCLCGVSSAQSLSKSNKIIDRTKNYLRKQKEEKAITYLEKNLVKYPESTKLLKYASVFFINLEDFEKAEGHLATAHALNPRDKRVSYSLYQTKKRLRKYDEAKLQLGQFLQIVDSNSDTYHKAKAEFDDIAIVDSIYNNPVSFEPINLGANINSEDPEYMPFITIDGTMIFARLIDRQEDLFIALSRGDSLSQALPISDINTDENEGTSCISPDGNFIFITKCNSKDGHGGCDIYVSARSDKGWSKPRNLGKKINTPAKETQPSLSADGKTLYFVSDRSGGFGKTDIYRSTFSKGWSKPENLGKTINTANRDESPFIHPDNTTFYFRSDGHPGMGSFDIFLSTKNQDTWSKPRNLGFPINQEGDEGSFFVDVFGNMAYFASDSYDDSHGGLDIYRFELPPELRPKALSYIKLELKDRQTELALEGNTSLTDIQTGEVVNQQSDVYGTVVSIIDPTVEYNLLASAVGYSFFTEHILFDSIASYNAPLVYTVYLDKLEPEKTIETNSTPIVLNNIFFESGSFELLDKSQYEIQNIATYLSKNQSLSMKIIGHTDDVGSEAANLLLSQQRANAVLEALVYKGIEKSRLSSVGKGEGEPKMSNDTEEGRKVNRRTEALIYNE